jgi:Raf kinase inhibitor-like YbhB/YbcL family protein
MQLRSDNFPHGKPIPPEFAFGKPGHPMALSDNHSPHLAWKDAPSGTRSFVLPGGPNGCCLPRVEFVHWLMANIPAECVELATGACSDDITPRGKQQPFGPPGSVQGVNSYTDWFKGDANMEGTYLGYDGPCPPWNDSLVHHYHFRVYALDTEKLALKSGFDLAQLRAALNGHVLAEATLTGTYSLNPKVPA